MSTPVARGGAEPNLMTFDSTTAEISVIIPSRNRRELLRECLASVRAQTFERWEAIVCDDGSTDGTDLMVRELMEHEPRVRFVGADGRRSGAPARRNDGMAVARGRYLLFLDDDDLLLPHCLGGRVRALEARPSCDAIVSEALLQCTEDPAPSSTFGSPSPTNYLARFLCDDWPWQTAGPLYRAAAARRAGPWNEALRTGQDVDFACRLLASGGRFAFIEGQDYIYRRLAGAGSIGARNDRPEYQCDHVARLAGLVRDHGDRLSVEERVACCIKLVRVMQIEAAAERGGTGAGALFDAVAATLPAGRRRFILRRLRRTEASGPTCGLWLDFLSPTGARRRQERICGHAWRAHKAKNPLVQLLAGMLAAAARPLDPEWAVIILKCFIARPLNLRRRADGFGSRA